MEPIKKGRVLNLITEIMLNGRKQCSKIQRIWLSTPTRSTNALITRNSKVDKISTHLTQLSTCPSLDYEMHNWTFIRLKDNKSIIFLLEFDSPVFVIKVSERLELRKKVGFILLYFVVFNLFLLFLNIFNFVLFHSFFSRLF